MYLVWLHCPGKANRITQNLFPFVEMAEKYGGESIHFDKDELCYIFIHTTFSPVSAPDLDNNAKGCILIIACHFQCNIVCARKIRIVRRQ